jgi:hypothetical protein
MTRNQATCDYCDTPTTCNEDHVRCCAALRDNATTQTDTNVADERNRAVHNTTVRGITTRAIIAGLLLTATITGCSTPTTTTGPTVTVTNTPPPVTVTITPPPVTDTLEDAATVATRIGCTNYQASTAPAGVTYGDCVYQGKNVKVFTFRTPELIGLYLFMLSGFNISPS